MRRLWRWLVRLVLGPNTRCRHGVLASEGVCPLCANGTSPALIVARAARECHEFAEEREWNRADYRCATPENVRGVRNVEIFILSGSEQGANVDRILAEVRQLQSIGAAKVYYVADGVVELWVEDSFI